MRHACGIKPCSCADPSCIFGSLFFSRCGTSPGACCGSIPCATARARWCSPGAPARGALARRLARRPAARSRPSRPPQRAAAAAAGAGRRGRAAPSGTEGSWRGRPCGRRPSGAMAHRPCRQATRPGKGGRRTGAALALRACLRGCVCGGSCAGCVCGGRSLALKCACLLLLAQSRADRVSAECVCCLAGLLQHQAAQTHACARCARCRELLPPSRLGGMHRGPPGRPPPREPFFDGRGPPSHHFPPGRPPFGPDGPHAPPHHFPPGRPPYPPRGFPGGPRHHPGEPGPDGRGPEGREPHWQSAAHRPGSGPPHGEPGPLPRPLEGRAAAESIAAALVSSAGGTAGAAAAAAGPEPGGGAPLATVPPKRRKRSRWEGEEQHRRSPPQSAPAANGEGRPGGSLLPPGALAELNAYIQCAVLCAAFSASRPQVAVWAWQAVHCCGPAACARVINPLALHRAGAGFGGGQPLPQSPPSRPPSILTTAAPVRETAGEPPSKRAAGGGSRRGGQQQAGQQDVDMAAGDGGTPDAAAAEAAAGRAVFSEGPSGSGGGTPDAAAAAAAAAGGPFGNPPRAGTPDAAADAGPGGAQRSPRQSTPDAAQVSPVREHGPGAAAPLPPAPAAALLRPPVGPSYPPPAAAGADGRLRGPSYGPPLPRAASGTLSDASRGESGGSGPPPRGGLPPRHPLAAAAAAVSNGAVAQQAQHMSPMTSSQSLPGANGTAAADPAQQATAESALAGDAAFFRPTVTVQVRLLSESFCFCTVLPSWGSVHIKHTLACMHFSIHDAVRPYRSAEGPRLCFLCTAEGFVGCCFCPLSATIPALILVPAYLPRSAG